MIHGKITPSGRGKAVVKNGGILPHQCDTGSQDCDMKETFQVRQEILQMPVLQCTDLGAFVRVRETQ